MALGTSTCRGLGEQVSRGTHAHCRSGAECLSTVPPGGVRAVCWATAGVPRICPVPAAAPPPPSLRSSDAAPKIPSLARQEAAASPAPSLGPQGLKGTFEAPQVPWFEACPNPQGAAVLLQLHLLPFILSAWLGVWQNRLAFAPGTPHFTYFPRETGLL